MKVQVTEEDIKNGCRGRAQYCPIALALRREFPERTFKVDNFGIVVDEKRWVILSEKAQSFVVDFDNRRNVTPFEFDFII